MEIKEKHKKNICQTCGTRYDSESYSEKSCKICKDDRQYINREGQLWISYDDLNQSHSIRIKQLRKDIYELQIVPSFAIGQKAHLIHTPNGNVLWDCLPYIDETTASFINSKGGLRAIAISHPHYYGLMVEWANIFNCPIYLHEEDREWVMDFHKLIRFWDDDSIELLPNLKMMHIGGHFQGSSVLSYNSEELPGTIFVGDTLYLSRDKKHISAMYSYPNVIPLQPKVLFDVFNKMQNIEFDALYGAFEWQNIPIGAKSLFETSFSRYKAIYEGFN